MLCKHRLQQHSAAQSIRIEPAAQKRSGVVSLWTILVLATLGLIGLTTVHLRIYGTAAGRARLCCQSAALAAGHAWLSDRLLSSNLQSFEVDALDIRCSEAAYRISDRYLPGSADYGTERVTVQTNWDNAADVLQKQAAIPKGLRVFYSEDGQQAASSPALFGVMPCRAAAAVAIENSPGGFSISRDGALPMFPFTLPETAPELPGAAGESSWKDQIEQFQGPDEFAWNPDTHRFEQGPDGIPELDLTLSTDDLSGGYAELIALDFNSSDAASPRSWNQCLAEGMHHRDLAERGWKSLDLAAQMESQRLSSADLYAASATLRKMQSVPGILFLSRSSGSSSTSFSGAGTVTLQRPVAARCVEARMLNSKQLQIRLQPGILVTSMAVDGKATAVADNRYIYSVRPLD